MKKTTPLASLGFFVPCLGKLLKFYRWDCDEKEIKEDHSELLIFSYFSLLLGEWGVAKGKGI